MEQMTVVLSLCLVCGVAILTGTLVVTTEEDGTRTFHLDMDPMESMKFIHDVSAIGYLVEVDDAETVANSDNLVIRTSDDVSNADEQ